MKEITSRTITQWVKTLLLSGIFGMIGNIVGYQIMPWDSLPGILILIIIGIIGLFFSKIVGKSLPAFVHVSIVGILVSMPWCPISGFVMNWVGKVNLMAIVTPILAYAGLTVGRDWRSFTKIGWKAIFIGLLVIFGTFFWSALIAEVLLRIQGTI